MRPLQAVQFVVLSLFLAEIISFVSSFSFYTHHGSDQEMGSGLFILHTLAESRNIQKFLHQFRAYESLPDGSDSRSSKTPQSTAASFREDIDFTVNPCDNFYQFACGGFINRTGPPSGFNSLLSSRRGAILDIIKQEIKKPIQLSDALPLRKAKQLYTSCINEEEIEKRGLTPIKNFLKDRGGWPVLGIWDRDRFDMVKLLTKINLLHKDWEFHYQPLGTIIGTSIQRDFRKQGQYAIYLDQPGLGQFSFFNLINHEVYRLGLDNFYNKAYEDYLVDIAVLLGADIKTARRDMRDVLIFETKLASIMLFEEERRLVKNRYMKMSILELSLRYPFIDWLQYFRKVLSIANIGVWLHTEVVLWAAPYYDRLGPILAKTSDRIIANYILFRGIQTLLPAMNKVVQYVYLRYIATVNGIREPRLPERTDYCTGIVNDEMSWVASRIFLEKSSTKQSVKYVTIIKDYVKSETLNMIKSADWLTYETKHFVLDKMKSLSIDIGFPNEVNDNSFLEKFYSKFNFDKSFFENIEGSLINKKKIILSKLIHPPLSEWILRPSDINGLHNLGTANIEITFGILGSPLFNLTHPPSMNFGGIGFLIGHEYGHGFERTGISFDGNGLLGNYWSKQSYANFIQKEKCFIEQYSRYYLPDLKLFVSNGGKTINENICDYLGLKSAFYAYHKFKQKNMIEDKLSGLPFTGDQLFFINYARNWCASASPVFLRKFPLLDHHAMNRLRVIGPLQNSEEFSNVFQCPVGSFMNPVRKCNFW